MQSSAISNDRLCSRPIHFRKKKSVIFFTRKKNVKEYHPKQR